MTMLSIEHASKHFGALKAVDDISLDVAPGEIVGLVGPNGSGKTTLLNLVSGFLAMTDGRIVIDGDDTSGAPPHMVARKGVSRTFQLIRLVETATVHENVLAGLYTDAPDRRLGHALVPFWVADRRRELDERAAAAIERLELSPYVGIVVEELPYGIQRRVELARAAVSQPALILLDEPAAGVTERDVQRLGNFIETEAERGCAVVLVDHHLRFVLDVCPRLVVMNFGEKIFDGSSGEATGNRAVREAYVGV
ncbi:MAG: ABC transporter ATP-binding protein [Actinobacteria bacterium]|nr:ABC transporter ATP-binding protein [Actinomycetota bacterium]